MRKPIIFFLAVFAVAASCSRDKKNATSAKDRKSRVSTYESVLIEDMPHVRQKPDFCGEACAVMVLSSLDHDMDQDYVFNRSGLDPLEGRGCYTAELSKALKKIGFKVGDVWRTIESTDKIGDEFKTLHKDLIEGIPSIVCMYSSGDSSATEHFRLVLGYDAKKDEVIYNEPAEDDGAYVRMARDKFLELWPLKGNSKWTVIRMRLEPGKIEEKKKFEGFTDADYAQHIMVLKEKIPGGFTMILQKPFVVIGDEQAQVVKKRSTMTIKWAVDMLKQDFFEKDPDDIIDIWLLKNKASYLKHTKELFGHNPGTPYGYYSEEQKALIMNIATGGGTLVHEIVHPFVASNFPGCPAWFNEGLGSLYEQCHEKQGHIAGMTNWRLPGLQDAIKEGTVPSFKELTHTTEDEFYDDKYGTNYGQSRYLCYYLQEQGLLVKYYHQFYKNRKKDPTGYKTLKKILEEDDMIAFKKRWETWVLKLVFK